VLDVAVSALSGVRGDVFLPALVVFWCAMHVHDAAVQWQVTAGAVDQVIGQGVWLWPRLGDLPQAGDRRATE